MWCLVRKPSFNNFQFAAMVRDTEIGDGCTHHRRHLLRAVWPGTAHCDICPGLCVHAGFAQTFGTSGGNIMFLSLHLERRQAGKLRQQTNERTGNWVLKKLKEGASQNGFTPSRWARVTRFKSKVPIYCFLIPIMDRNCGLGSSVVPREFSAAHTLRGHYLDRSGRGDTGRACRPALGRFELRSFAAALGFLYCGVARRCA